MPNTIESELDPAVLFNSWMNSWHWPVEVGTAKVARGTITALVGSLAKVTLKEKSHSWL